MTSPKNKTLGERIKAARLEHGMTQLELARLTDVTAESVVSHWESDKRRPSVKRLGKIAAALGVQVGDLIGETIPAIPDDDGSLAVLVRRVLRELRSLRTQVDAIQADLAELRGVPPASARPPGGRRGR